MSKGGGGGDIYPITAELLGELQTAAAAAASPPQLASETRQPASPTVDATYLSRRRWAEMEERRIPFFPPSASRTVPWNGDGSGVSEWDVPLMIPNKEDILSRTTIATAVNCRHP